MAVLWWLQVQLETADLHLNSELLRCGQQWDLHCPCSVHLKAYTLSSCVYIPNSQGWCFGKVFKSCSCPHPSWPWDRPASCAAVCAGFRTQMQCQSTSSETVALKRPWKSCDVPDISFWLQWQLLWGFLGGVFVCFWGFFRGGGFFWVLFVCFFFFFFLFPHPQVILNLDQFPDLINFTVTQIVVLAQQREQQELAEGAVAAHSSSCTGRKTP